MKSTFHLMAVLAFIVSFGFAGSTALAQNNPEGMAYATVVTCDDADCTTTSAGMEGAVVASFDGAGAEIDSCAVEVFPSGLDGCIVTRHDGDGWYEVSNLAEGYSLVSDSPEVLQSESHGTQLVWYAAPAADPVPPSDGPVTELPETGVGIGNSSGYLAAAAFGIALIAIGSCTARRWR